MINKTLFESIEERKEFNEKIINFLDSWNGFDELEKFFNNAIQDYSTIQILFENHKNEYIKPLGKTGSFERGIFIIDFINFLFSVEIGEIKNQSDCKIANIEIHQIDLSDLIYNKQILKSQIININNKEDCIFEAELSFEVKLFDRLYIRVYICKIKKIKPYKFEILTYEIQNGEVFHSKLNNNLYSIEIPETLSEYNIIKSANKIINYLLEYRDYSFNKDRILNLKSKFIDYENTESKRTYSKIYRAYVMKDKINKKIDIKIIEQKPFIMKITSDKLSFTHDEMYLSSSETVENYLLKGDYKEAIIEGKKEIRKHTQTLPYL